VLPCPGTWGSVAAKRRRATGLDRRHDLELMKAQVPGMGGPVGGADGTEDIGDLDQGAQAASGVGILALHQQRQTLQRTRHRADRLGGNARIERSRIKLAVAKRTRVILRLGLCH
jgi:hypothetical protein